MNDCINLSGTWALSCSNWSDGDQIPAQLPGDNYSALLAAGRIPDPYFGENEEIVQSYRDCSFAFERQFEVAPEFLNFKSVYLNAEKVDTFATISLNGRIVMHTANMFRRYQLEVKKYLKPGTNTIKINFKPVMPLVKKLADAQDFKLRLRTGATLRGLNLVRKTHCHGGWDWGITLMVSGIYEPLTLHGVNHARIDHVYTEQQHRGEQVKLTAIAELSAVEAGNAQVTFIFNNVEKVQAVKLKRGPNLVRCNFNVEHPELWWPAGYGAQALYPLTVRTADETRQLQIGLRRLEIINQPDQYGVSFQVRVNGVDIFCKGADWIPDDALPSRQTPERCEDLLESARLAHMNMIRVWGGGQYESDFFYEICDRKGLLVWQDMMFACAQYPSTPEFLENVGAEIEFQMKRLRHHAALALWCGDNEAQAPARSTPELLVNYDRLNRELARLAAQYDPERVFWPSSPCGGPSHFAAGWGDASCGDMHYWEVWHHGKTFEAYYQVEPRFCSEFGFQSFPSDETVQSFCPADQRNVFSPVMERHEKCYTGVAPIVTMFSHYFRMPEKFTDFLFLSQAQQAQAIKTGVEFWRSLKPQCMGTLYWQLNDNWPVASWSSLEYGGHWKQLHYQARRFYAPVIAMIYRAPQSGKLELHIVSDVPQKLQVTLQATLYNLHGEMLNQFNFNTALGAQKARKIHSFAASDFGTTPSNQRFIVLECTAVAPDGQKFHHDNTFFFEPFRCCPLERPQISWQIQNRGTELSVLIHTDVPAFFVTLETPGVPGIFSDNSFTLLPQPDRELTFTPRRTCTLAELKKVLTVNYLK